MRNVLETPRVTGDGCRDDTEGLQAALDSGAGTVYLPAPPVCYLISRTLKIHSGQTLIADPTAVIRLADGADAIMIENARPDEGDEHITLLGGIWDMNNAHQSPHPPWRGQSYEQDRWIGVLMRFNGVRNLCIRDLTLKDPESFGMQLGRLEQFTIENITFDYNLMRPNMDGVHVHGPSRWGRIANLKGTTNDDLVALNADDGGCYEMCRGPIEDVSVDGVFSEDGYTAVRLLSAGSPVRRISIRNVFGTYRFNAVSFTNHHVHPGTPSTFDDVSISSVFCGKSVMGMGADVEKMRVLMHSPIRIEAPAVISSLTITDYHRTEHSLPLPDIGVSEGAEVGFLSVRDSTHTNHCGEPSVLIENHGKIRNLSLSGICMRTPPSSEHDGVILDKGAVERCSKEAVFAEDV